MSGRRLELSATQLTASVMAAVTAAVCASYLGVAGTIIGAGVVSFASTAGTAIYRHYLGRTEEKLRAAAAQLPHGNIRVGSHRATAPGSPAAATVPEKAGVPGRHTSGNLDPGPVPGAPPRDDGRTGTWAEALAGAPPRVGEHPAPTELTGPATADEGPRPAAADGGSGQHAAVKPARPRWLAWVGLAAAVFLLTMAAITVVEVATGKPLSASVWHHHGSGTTIGDVVTGRTGSGTVTTHPTGHPSGRATAPATTGTTPSPGQTGQASPTATPTTPTPSPTGTEPSPGGSADPPSPAAS